MQDMKACARDLRTFPNSAELPVALAVAFHGRATLIPHLSEMQYSRSPGHLSWEV